MASKMYISVKITNIQTNEILSFKGNEEASKYLNIGESTLRRYKKSSTLYLDKYLIENS
jgi:hypothetical protein